MCSDRWSRPPPPPPSYLLSVGAAIAAAESPQLDRPIFVLKIRFRILFFGPNYKIIIQLKTIFYKSDTYNGWSIIFLKDTLQIGKTCCISCVLLSSDWGWLRVSLNMPMLASGRTMGLRLPTACWTAARSGSVRVIRLTLHTGCPCQVTSSHHPLPSILRTGHTKTSIFEILNTGENGAGMHNSFCISVSSSSFVFLASL